MKFWLMVLITLFSSCKIDTTSETKSENGRSAYNAGTYRISGKNSYGSFTGTGQLIGTEESQTSIRMISYNNVSFKDRSVHQVWQGKLNSSNQQMNFLLPNANFIFATQNDYRASIVSGKISGNSTFKIEWNDRSAEEWTFINTEQNPIWKNERFERIVTSKAQSNLSGLLNELSNSYSKQPFLDLYRKRTEFINETPVTVVDLTDLAFLRSNPQAIRVIQTTINDDSLMEAYSRSLAYGHPLANKEAYFMEKMFEKYINTTGFFATRSSDGSYIPDGDSATWTGTWMFVMVSKYLKTPNNTLATQIQTTVSSFINALNIAKEGKSFARYVDINRSGYSLIQSQTYPHLCYLAGGNNDMLKGLLTGLYWGVVGLKAQNQLDPFRGNILDALNTVEQHSEHARSDINSLLLNMVRYETQANNDHKKKVIAKLNIKNITQIKQGGIPMNLKGISDWSGNHLNTITFMMLRDFFKKYPLVFFTIDGIVRSGLADLSGSLKGHRLGLLDLVAGQWRKDVDAEQVKDGIIRMIEIPILRGLFKVEHIKNPDFIMSPYPGLPWKNDWQTAEGNRKQSLKNYPIFELGFDSYYWKSNFYDSALNSGISGDRQQVGLDFLVSYWFCQYSGISLSGY